MKVIRGNVISSIIFGLFIVLVLIGSLYFFSFNLIGNRKVEVSYGETYKDLGYKINLFSISLGKLVETKNNVDTKQIGNYKVVYKLPFKTLIREVVVVDKEPPTLELLGDSVMEINVGSTYLEPGFKAMDNLDLEITDKVIVSSNLDSKKIGEYQIKYQVKDSSGNSVDITRTIKVVDKISPIISLKGVNKVIVKLNENYEEAGYIANDNYDGDITKNVKVERNIDFSKVGTYYIKYSCFDSSSNYTEAIRTIDVIENIDITYINGILLVNKKYHLPSDYNPGVNSEAYNALLNLQRSGKENGYDIPLLSGFRSYETQKYLFNDYANRNGYELANTFSALPGQSEHQTGLAFDVGEISYSYGDTEAGIWLSQNAHKFGFIIRYLKGKESITGYKYEPWHIRYVGNVAPEIYSKGITLEEYLKVN